MVAMLQSPSTEGMLQDGKEVCPSSNTVAVLKCNLDILNICYSNFFINILTTTSKTHFKT